MMTTKFMGLMVIKISNERRLSKPLSPSLPKSWPAARKFGEIQVLDFLTY